jgi:hypothetical protein
MSKKNGAKVTPIEPGERTVLFKNVPEMHRDWQRQEGVYRSLRNKHHLTPQQMLAIYNGNFPSGIHTGVVRKVRTSLNKAGWTPPENKM